MRKKKTSPKQIVQYEHNNADRVNNPPVGLVNLQTDPDTGAKQKYQYDPHLDPQLQWTGKAEHTSFDVPTVSLHVHERIDPKTIIESVRKDAGDDGQLSMFAEKVPLRKAVDFYKHREGSTNRLVAGDSLLVMNSLLEKEALGGKVQTIYFDPPYGIKYGSNFQPFTNKRDVKDGKDDDLSAEPEMIKAFRDTWELGIHSYLTYLRDRLLLAKEMLTDSGSCFVQISDENVHHVREIMDEVFGAENFVSLINFRKTTSASGSGLSAVSDYLIWYGKNIRKLKMRSLFLERAGEGWVNYNYIRLPNGEHRRMTIEETNNWKLIPENASIYRRDNLTSQRPAGGTDVREFEYEGRNYKPGKGTFKTDLIGLERLAKSERLEGYGSTLSYRRFANDFPFIPLSNFWDDTLTGGYAEDRFYVVQTIKKVIQRCLLMTTDPGDLVLDITCGSGTTAFVAEQWGRRWITCDTSRVALTLAKQRLMTANFDYYKLAHPDEGVGSGFDYKTVPHITLKSIANNEPPATETLYDQPFKENNKSRVTGPFTVEAVPAPYASSLDEFDAKDASTSLGISNPKAVTSHRTPKKDASGIADSSIARSGETLRQSEWRDELLRAGVRGKSGNKIEFTRVEPMRGTKFIQGIAETREDAPKKVLLVFGPEHAPLEQRTVESAWQEARDFRPDILLFCAFQFEEEAAKDIDELTPEKAGMQLLKVQMNADMLTDDLRKKRSSNESFWLIGQPDVKVHQLEDGKTQVEVLGFDYYNPVTGNVESGGKNNIALWMLDTDYDNRSLFPSQVFFPMAGSGDGWGKLAKNLKAEIDEEKMEAFRGTISLPFEAGDSIAVKIIDDRGIESLRVIKI